MRQHQDTLSVATRGPGLYEITAAVAGVARSSGIVTGLLTLFIRHTSASLTIQENADPDVQADLVDALARLAPEDPGRYRHGCEGPDDMPAHIKAALTDVSIAIPIADGRPVLGTWQGVYVVEHRRRGHQRQVTCHIIGE